MSPEVAQALIGAALAALERDPKRADLARIGYRNQNGSKLFRSPESQQEIEVARAERQRTRAARKAERDRKRDLRRKARR